MGERTAWSDSVDEGALVMSTGTSGSDPHLERCEGSVQGTVASEVGSHIHWQHSLEKLASPLVPEQKAPKTVRGPREAK